MADKPSAEPSTPNAATPTGNPPPNTTPPSAKPINIKLDLPVGAVVATPRDRYTILAPLAKSGLTKLYLVMNSCKVRRVMRVEYSKIPRNYSRIKTELPLLENLSRVNRDYKSHFLTLFDKGRTNIFKFVIVLQVGPTLLQIREKLLEQDDFTEFTAFYIACGTFQAIRDLHLLDFVHRDINLGKFAIGLGHYEKQIFMYNLKDMKKIRTANGHIKPSKEEKLFDGSLLFGSRNAMRGGEQSRKDDLESWLYMLFDVYDRQTFCSFFDRRLLSEAIQIKHEIMSGKLSQSFFKKIPRQFMKLCKYVNCLEWDADPDYETIKDLLLSAMPPNELRRDQPQLDWTGKIELRDDLKDMDRIFNYRKPNCRAEIITNHEWSSNSDGSTADDDMTSTPSKDPVKSSAQLTRSKQQRRGANVGGRKKTPANRSTVQRRKGSRDTTKSGRVPSILEESNKKARRYKGSRGSTGAKRGPDQEPSSVSGISQGPPSREIAPPSREIAPPSREITGPALTQSSNITENGSATTILSKESTSGSFSAAEKQKHAEKLRRQMHINVTETTEEDVKFTFHNDKKTPM